MSFKDNIKKHFKEKLGGELNKMTVSEWGIDVFYKSAYSFAVESKIIALQQDKKTVEAIVESIIQKALDPEGKPMFHSSDRHMLMFEADPEVLLRMSSVLNGSVDEYEDIAKN
jgi:hypothetical protein